jgi:hypothetical protein
VLQLEGLKQQLDEEGEFEGEDHIKAKRRVAL